MADSLLYRHWTRVERRQTHPRPAGRSGHRQSARPDAGKFRRAAVSARRRRCNTISRPTARELVFASNHDRAPASSTNSDLWLVPLAGTGQPRNITASNPAFDGNPQYSPDGRYIAYRMQKQPGYESDLFRLAIYDRSTGTSRVLTESFRNWVDDFQWARGLEIALLSAPVEGNNPSSA